MIVFRGVRARNGLEVHSGSDARDLARGERKIFDEGTPKVLAHREDVIEAPVEIALILNRLIDAMPGQSSYADRGAESHHDVAIVVGGTPSSPVGNRGRIKETSDLEESTFEIFRLDASGHRPGQSSTVGWIEIIVLAPDTLAKLHVAGQVQNLVDPRNIGAKGAPEQSRPSRRAKKEGTDTGPTSRAKGIRPDETAAYDSCEGW